jgi:uridine phosphorylase
MDKFIPDSELILNADGSIYHLNLKPEHLASTILTVGDPDRVPMISGFFDEIEVKVSKREFVTHTGWYKGRRLSVMSTGMGTDNIEIFMTELDALVNVDFRTRMPKKNHTTLSIIRLGTSGSMQSNIPEGSLLASHHAIGLDTLMTFYNARYSALEKEIGAAVQQQLSLPFSPYCVEGSTGLFEKFGEGILSGNTLTCPGFYGPQGREVRLEPRIPGMIEKLSRLRIGKISLSNFEMETSGYYAMGRLLGHEVLSLNAIVANRITKKFTSDPNEVVERLIKHTLLHL